jgi:hypothetical protein
MFAGMLSICRLCGRDDHRYSIFAENPGQFKFILCHSAKPRRLFCIPFKKYYHLDGKQSAYRSMLQFPSRKKRCNSIDEQYAYWRIRILYSLIVGYATFYLVRQNFQVATPKMLNELGYTRAEIGWVFSAFAII